jgi:large subunit ribosomal protein L3
MFGYIKKIGMTRLFVDGKSTAVTVVSYCKPTLLQTKTVQKDGYSAVQLGAVKQKKVTKPLLAHIQKNAKVDHGFRFISEFPIEKEGAEINLDFSVFKPGDKLKLSGTSKGKGFTGAVKRWGFAGQPASHGHDHVRAVGSIGTREPQRVLPGKKMAGRSGNSLVTLAKVKIVNVDPAKKFLFLEGSLPGANGGYLKFNQI